MIRIELHIALDYEVEPQGADFILNVQAANTPRQSEIVESMLVNQPIAQVHKSRLPIEPLFTWL